MPGPARHVNLNVSHTLRRDFTFATPLQTDGNGSYVEFAFMLPAGSVHTSTQLVTATAFNAGTGNTVSLGRATATDMMPATAVSAVGVQNVVGSGRVGTNDVNVKIYVTTGGAAATAGDVTVIVHYVATGT